MDKKQIGYMIKTIHNKLEKRANNDLRAADLTLMQVTSLVYLKDRLPDPVPMKEFEHFFDIAQPTVAGVIARLEKKGLVRTVQSPEDKRVKLVAVTDEGIRLADETSENVSGTENILLKGFSEEEKELLQDLLYRALRNLD